MKGYVADPAAPGGVSLQQLDDPRPGAGEVVVAVAAASLNRGEVQHVREYASLPPGGPTGWDVAGTVIQEASDGVGPPLGSQVYGWCERRGSWAERVAVRSEHLAELPAGLSLIDASTLGVAGLTAWAALRRHPAPLAETTVMVTGATGGVGLLALQLAAIEGAQVNASVRNDVGAQIVRTALGPTGDVAIEVGLDPAGAPMGLIVDSVGGDLLGNAVQRVSHGGTVVTLGRTSAAPSSIPSGWFLKGASLQGLAFSRDYAAVGSTQAALARLGDLVVAGRLRANVAEVVDAADLVAAMDALIERRVHGKIVIRWAH